MKITQHISEAKETLFSFELLPPLKGENIQQINGTVEHLLEFNPAFVDVTYHREEYLYREMTGGLLKKRTVRKRPGTVGICAAISHKYNLDTVPHIICGGFTKEETENALIDLDFVGVENVLVLRGDPIRGEGRFKGEADGHSYAIDLVNQVADMNRGKYLDPELKNSNATNFCLGVAGYPEKHFEAPNLSSDLRWLKRKVEDGAEYIITQMFFDNEAYFDFVSKCREHGIDIPIIPGLKPLTTKRQLTSLPKNFHVNMPDELVRMVENAASKEAVKEAGVAWCIQQAKELKAANVPVLHFYTMGKANPTAEIARAVF
ncbi:methylenetetrahydrofolate reductase [NAD(P)H] [Flavobacteriales bacterium]|jgi:methylenetetrahydrofolate reductase (NADPH)|nr:methylenetetrahydrofolate reductase [NAD(P)H] [Flavobacteriales bacterium]